MSPRESDEIASLAGQATFRKASRSPADVVQVLQNTGLRLVEDALLDRFDVVLDLVEDVEVVVDDSVHEPVREEVRAAVRDPAFVLRPLRGRLVDDVDVGRRHRHEPPLADEKADGVGPDLLLQRDLVALTEADGLEENERVRFVLGGLRPRLVVDNVVDGQPVDSESVLERLQFVRFDPGGVNPRLPRCGDCGRRIVVSLYAVVGVDHGAKGHVSPPVADDRAIATSVNPTMIAVRENARPAYATEIPTTYPTTPTAATPTPASRTRFIAPPSTAAQKKLWCGPRSGTPSRMAFGRRYAASRTWSAAFSASAAIVSVGFIAPPVGKTLLEAIQQFSRSWVRRSGPTTLSAGSDPIRVVPM